MSWPVEVILTWDKYEELSEQEEKPLIKKINAWMEANANDRQSGEFHAMPDEFANGYDADNIYFGVFNYFSPDELLSYLRTLPWETPNSIQLMVRDFEESVFEFYTLTDFRPDESKDNAQTIESNARNGDFTGQVFAFDGELTLRTKEQWGELIERGGGYVTFAVSKRTTCIIGGFNRDGDWAKAHRLGITMIEERKFHEQFQGKANN